MAKKIGTARIRLYRDSGKVYGIVEHSGTRGRQTVVRPIGLPTDRASRAAGVESLAADAYVQLGITEEVND